MLSALRRPSTVEMSPPVVVVAPSVEPVPLAEVKDHLHVLHATEDARILRLLKAARGYVERITGRALVMQTLEVSLSGFPPDAEIVLPRPPLAALTEIAYDDVDGVARTMSLADVEVVATPIFAAIRLRRSKSWPAVGDGHRPVRIRYTAGAAVVEGAAAIDDDMRAAILLLAGHYYTDTEGEKPVPPSVINLLAPHRTFGWV